MLHLQQIIVGMLCSILVKALRNISYNFFYLNTLKIRRFLITFYRLEEKHVGKVTDVLFISYFEVRMCY
jgi:hypothetical protein